MDYKQIDNKVVLYNAKNFNIEEILECGQCFRFEKKSELHYKVVAMDRVLFIKQCGYDVEFYPCTKADFENIWIHYFDLETDYGYIKKAVSNDDIMQRATEYAGGIRLLNQSPFECLLSFIISQNNNIPRIKGIIAKMAEKYGTKYGDEYLFPTLEQLLCATTDELYELKMGFRAKYIYDAIDKIKTGVVDLNKIDELSTDELKAMLIKIKGVGVKVADCTMLFSMNRRDVFPTDVWIKRVMEYFYFNGEPTDIGTIHSFAKDKWGDLAGYAQQYLFYYARSLKIGTKEK